MENQLFIIPIFLRSPEQYELERITKERREIEVGGKYQFGKLFELKWPPWQYNDIIGSFEVLVNSHKVLFVHKYRTETKRISRNPNERKKHRIFLSHEFTESSCYKQLVKYFDNPKLDLKDRVLKILDELDNYVKRKENFIDVIYYQKIIQSLDIEKYIRISGSELE